MPLVFFLLTNLPFVFMVAVWTQALDLIWIEHEANKTIYRFCYGFMIMFFYNFIGVLTLIAFRKNRLIP